MATSVKSITPPPSAKRAVWSRPEVLCPLLIATVITLAYANTLHVPLLFDDVSSIRHNPSIHSLATAWNPPHDYGYTVSGRPLLNFTFALNYAISGSEVWSYHLGNLLVHILAALTLFGLLRRTLRLPSLEKNYSGQATPFACGLALLWSLHPLQTESVTYIVQRAESLMGLFFLLTLYGWVRALDSSRPLRWHVFAWVACLLGMACKEVMVAAPLVVLLYDRTFGTGNFSETWRRHRWPLVALFATWLPLAWFVASTGGDRGGTFELTPVTFGEYWLTQLVAVTHYLRLAIWPAPLVFDYGLFKTIPLARAIAPALLVAFLLGATAWSLRRRPIIGFSAACFFLILAPTSLLPGVMQLMAEHRMYLPLLPVLGGAVFGLYRWLGSRAIWVIAAWAVLLGGLTFVRNQDYRSAFTLWSATAESYPESERAHNNLGLEWQNRGKIDQAIAEYRRALEVQPRYVSALSNLGLALLELGRTEEAIASLESAVALVPDHADAQLALGNALAHAGRTEEAIDALNTALHLQPGLATVHHHLARLLARSGRPGAGEHYAEALRIAPADAETQIDYGVLLARSGQTQVALEHLREAVRLQPDSAEAQANLGNVYFMTGRIQEAIDHYLEALRLQPGDVRTQENLRLAREALQR